MEGNKFEIKIIRLEDNKFDANIVNKGFNKVEMLGLLEMIKEKIINS
jgi:hypothetical protein